MAPLPGEEAAAASAAGVAPAHEEAEARLAPTTAIMREWSGRVPGLREATGGPDAFDAILERAEHVFLPFETGLIHLEVHPADAPGAPTIVFSAGIGGHARYYSSAFGTMRRAGFNVVGVDRPGHGLSEGRRGHAPVDITLEALETVIDYAHERFPGPVVLAGASVGGIVTWYALTRGFDVAAAVCQSIHHPELRFDDAIRERVPKLRALVEADPHSYIPTKLLANFDRVSKDPEILAYFAEERDPVWVWNLTADSSLTYFDFEVEKDWPEVETPTLVIQGSDDELITEEYTREVLAMSSPPNVELHLVPGAGHLLFQEYLPATVAALSEFVRKHTGHGQGDQGIGAGAA